MGNCCSSHEEEVADICNDIVVSPQIGSFAPDFTLEAVMPNGKMGNVSLSDYEGKWVVLFFYPLDFTFVCPTEIIEFSKRHGEFEKLGAQILGVSVDSVYSHDAWVKGDLGKLNYPLLSDINKAVSYEYGVLLDDKGIALRGTYIIDPEGKVRVKIVHDLPIGRSVDETIRVLTALGTGELCPVGWQKGGKTLGKA